MSITSYPALGSLKEFCPKNASAERDDMAFGDDKPSGVTGDGTISSEAQPSSRTPKIHVHQKPASLRTTTPAKQGSNPVSSTTPKQQKLDSKASEGGHRKSTLGSPKVSKHSQDAYARYKSDANSFPDYGAPKHSEAMSAKDRLKAINSLPKPVNTLTPRPSEIDDMGDTPPAKRHKPSPQASPNFSQHFSQQTRPKNYESWDVIVNGSQNDPYEFQSVSSSGNQKPVASGLLEYRNAQPKVAGRPRARISRIKKSPTQGGGRILDSFREPDLMIANRSTYRDVSSPDPESPDALTSKDPPPAMVISDITQSRRSKREREPQLTDLVEPQIKRPKPPAPKEPIELSEDELLMEGPKTAISVNAVSRAAAATTYMKNLVGGRLRGDIQSTNFHGPSLSSRSRKSTDDGMALVRAVCGERTYQHDADATQGRIFLHQSGTKIEPRNEAGQKLDEIRWLEIELSQVQFIRHPIMPCRHVLIDRPRTTEAMPKLHLEFLSSEDAEALLDILRGIEQGPRTHDDVEKMMNKAFEEAKGYERQNEVCLIKSHEDKHPAPTSQRILDAQEKPSRPEKMKDKLLKSSIDVDSNPVSVTNARPILQQYSSATRRSSRLSSGPLIRQLSPESWTELHPDWQKNWPRSLIYPATGKNRATVDKDDIVRLNEGEFLNDNLISFYLRYLQQNLEERRPEILNKVYIFNTFFFEKLRSTKGKINYEGVKAWTAKVDLFSYDYIVVPVNEHAHWYLAIICNASNALPSSKEGRPSSTPAQEAPEVVNIPSSPKMSTMERSMSDISLQDDDEGMINKQLREATNGVTEALPSPSSPSKKRPAGVSSKGDPTQPKIITLDSLGSPHNPTCKALREYLIQEAKSRKNVDLATPPPGMTAIRIPEQNNYCDCGIYVLGYMREFLKDPDSAAHKLLQKQAIGWDIRPSELRGQIRTLLFDLQKEQEGRLELERQRRKGLKKALKNTQNSPPPMLPRSSPAPDLPGSYPQSSPQRQQKIETAIPSSEATLQEPCQVKKTETILLVEVAKGEGEGKKQQSSEVETRESNSIKDLATEPRSSSDATVETYYSTSSSPTLKPESHRAQLVVELKASKDSRELVRRDPIPLEGKLEYKFVQPLSSPESKTRPTHRSRHKIRRPSIEFMEERKAPALPPNPRIDRDADASRFFQPVQTVESDNVEEPSGKSNYDGIDRSVDLTKS